MKKWLAEQLKVAKEPERTPELYFCAFFGLDYWNLWFMMR